MLRNLESLGNQKVGNRCHYSDFARYVSSRVFRRRGFLRCVKTTDACARGVRTVRPPTADTSQAGPWLDSIYGIE
jgi:hypothetical protein